MARHGSRLQQLRGRIARRLTTYRYGEAIPHYADALRGFRLPDDVTSPVRIDLTAKFDLNESNGIWAIGFLVLGGIWLAAKGADWDVLLFVSSLVGFLALFFFWHWISLAVQDRVVEFHESGVAEIDPFDDDKTLVFTPYRSFKGVTKYRMDNGTVFRGIKNAQPIVVVELRHQDYRRSVPLHIEVFPQNEREANRLWVEYAERFDVPMLDELGFRLKDRAGAQVIAS